MSDPALAATEPPLPPARAEARRVAVICNPGSGRNSRESDAVDRAVAEMGPGTKLVRLKKGQDIADCVRNAIDEGHDTIVAAGGDGTIMTVAGTLIGTGIRMGVLPLGTFNFFARGLDIPDEPEEAGRVIRDGRPQMLTLGEVNGQLFLNNASIGIYPAILRAREDVYSRWGRRQIAAHWSVVKTFIQFQRPMHLTLTADGTTRRFRTPLVFAARSSFQLQHYNLEGADCVKNGQFAIFIAPDKGRWGLFKEAWRLMRRNMEIGTDFELICTEHAVIETQRKRQLVACDGEKFRMDSPLTLSMQHRALEVLVPNTSGAEPGEPLDDVAGKDDGAA